MVFNLREHHDQTTHTCISTQGGGVKVIFEFDDNLIEETYMESTLFFNEKLKQVVAREIKKQLVDEYVKKLPDFGDLGITKEELKQEVLERMAERALEKDEA